MANAERAGSEAKTVETKLSEESLPKPTLLFRQRAWRVFQRALDPLASAKPLRPPKR